ncbi:MAG: EamA family transporter, partial [Actinomycetota bacterium]
FALIKEVGAARATLITYLNTLVSLILGIVFLGEPITTGLLVGMPLVLIGSWFAGKRHAETKRQLRKKAEIEAIPNA